MKKVFYESKLAKLILFKGYSTITLGAFVFTKLSKTDVRQYLINHEVIHTKQWIECAFVGGIITWLLVMLFDISSWWMLLSLAIFYILYLLETFIKFFKYGTDVYEHISFEKEAEQGETNETYLENSGYFEWIKYMF